MFLRVLDYNVYILHIKTLLRSDSIGPVNVSTFFQLWDVYCYSVLLRERQSARGLGFFHSLKIAYNNQVCLKHFKYKHTFSQHIEGVADLLSSAAWQVVSSS